MNKKVIFVSSSGGHLSELLMLSELFEEYEYMLVTELTQVTKTYEGKYNIKYLKYGPNKNIIKYIYAVIYNIVQSFKIIRKFKPQTVVTTGAQVGGIFVFIAKLFRAKVIYIESLARTSGLSITGKVAYRFADKFYVQWEDTAKEYEKAEYLGRLM